MKTTPANLLAFGALLLAPIAIGCGDNNTANPATSTPTSDDHGSQDRHKVEGHSHGAGPHDGTIADWGGGKYHVEFTVDHDKQEATAYLLGTDEKTPSPIATEEIQLSIKSPAMQVTLKASPQDRDPEGFSSRFVGNHDSLGVVQAYEGTIMGVVDDTPYAGNFKEEPHGNDE